MRGPRRQASPLPPAKTLLAELPLRAASNETHLSIVGIGASAGGLETCRNLISALPVNTGMAFILVQHLDPHHKSMMVDLLSSRTSLIVLQATEGMLIEPDHFYVIPPGSYLSVGKAVLHLSDPESPNATRLPFDFLLRSMAENCGARAIGVILSGTGSDGSLGAKAVKEKSGFIIAQDPDEARFGGMPRSAIMTGAVDLVLPVAKIPEALIAHSRHPNSPPRHQEPEPQDGTPDGFFEIIDLLRTKTPYDFRLYKQGTLQRRIERRMGMIGVVANGMGRYVELLRGDASELDHLAKDLLINVTGFFRDQSVFDLLAAKIIPDLVRNLPDDQSLRIWIAGCSTGEEAYSLAMLFDEEIATTRRNIKLQVFASDVDPDAVAVARTGFYPKTIEVRISQARLGRFFSKEESGYRVLPELRALVVFTVQDILADPPFSRMDLVSCRNLLIYLGTEAQAKAISLFHLALRQGGILLLGNSETISNFDDRFEVLSKSERLYKHIGRSRPGELGLIMSQNDGMRAVTSSTQTQMPSRQTIFAELCRRLVIETYAPAAVLINRKYECLYFLGPTDRYLRVAAGSPTHELLAMAREGLRTKLRAAIQQAGQENRQITVSAGKAVHDGETHALNISVQPVPGDGEAFMLICFIEGPKQEGVRPRSMVQEDVPQIKSLQQELDATRGELQGAIRNLEIAAEEQKSINDEALSVNEEFQSTNEELLTSKEELQSVNEELTALNSQLQETLERQRTTSNDLQNILYSTDVATLFLDADLNIRFFTPATKLLFNVIPSDIGRPLADLHSLAADSNLLVDARTVLHHPTPPIECEIQAPGGLWYIRRIFPYRTPDSGIEGVVITFIDNTERRRTADALEIAKREAQLASAAKSRFLAVASHDLRQPMQALNLMRGILVKKIQADKKQEALDLVVKLDNTAAAMSRMLNTLLDINQLESGTVQPHIIVFSVDDMFDRLLEEFSYLAEAQKLVLRVVQCRLSIRSDPRLLEQMIRNLLANALKYTKKGKILLGCRRRKGVLSIEIYDTGIGIARPELKAIFEEYYQLDNARQERSRGLGLGLSIVQRLGILLGHQVHVRSQPGRGSVFSIEVALPSKSEPLLETQLHKQDHITDGLAKKGTILVIGDDADLRDILRNLLAEEGYLMTTASDGDVALKLVAQAKIRPDLIIIDDHLPDGTHGLDVTAKIRDTLGRSIPVIILAGDLPIDTLQGIISQGFVKLNKPMKSNEITQAVRRLIVSSASTPASQYTHTPINYQNTVIFVVDDDPSVGLAIRGFLEADGWVVEDYRSCEAFLAAYHPGRMGCLLIDAYLPGMKGLELLQRLKEAGDPLPAIMITGQSDVTMAVQAMKAGALDFIEKPLSRVELLASLGGALERAKDVTTLSAWHEDARARVASLTLRQRQIMKLVLAGHPNKNIAADLGISQRTVENHRASIMKKTGSKSLPALARLALAAEGISEPIRH